jgi:NAD(P)-dependent dehydrogenase (short-subunit alcohol dehydrogenase family)
MKGLDTLVNSAGVIETKKLEDISEEEWDWIMDINAKGTFLATQAAMPYLKESKNGRVVNLSSTGGINGFPLISPYCASKFAVTGMTQSISQEAAPYGVTVNAVCPATVFTTGMGEKVASQKVQHYKEFGFSKGDLDTILEEGAESFPLGRLGTVEDVVSLIMYLISENASWITGESINIDGGTLSG